MILSERELELGPDHTGSSCSPEAIRAGDAARRRAAARGGRARDRGDAEPARPARRLRDRARGRGAHERRAPAATRCGGARGPTGEVRSRSPSRISKAAPCYIGRLFRDVPIGSVAAVAEGPADGRRPAPDLERRRRDELRHAGARAARSTRSTPTSCPRPGSSSVRARGGADPDARRRRPQARSSRPADHRRRAADRTRRDHGRRGDRGHRDDRERPARGGELRARRDPADLRAPGPSHGRVEPLGEGGRSVPRAPGRRTRHQVDPRRVAGRALGRGGRGDRGATGATQGPFPAPTRRRRHRPRGRAGRAERHPDEHRLRGRRGLERHGPHLAGARRDARDRPDRGGRPLPARGGSVHAPAAAGRVRPPVQARAAPAAARSKTFWSGSASTRRTPGACRRAIADPHALVVPEPISAEHAA